MKLSALKSFLSNTDQLHIYLPSKLMIPSHFHITEIGLIQKHFIDCGGTVRNEKHASMQIWLANDTEHRLTPKKLNSIIAQYESIITEDDFEIEVEYQTDTISKYGLDIQNNALVLTPTFTNCLAQDSCGIPKEKLHVNLSELTPTEASCCTPGGGCC